MVVTVVLRVGMQSQFEDASGSCLYMVEMRQTFLSIVDNATDREKI